MIFKNNNSHKVGTDQNNKGRKEQIFLMRKSDQSLEENNDENKKSSTKTINGLR